MSIAGKIFNRLTFRCLCALGIGMAVVAVFSGLLVIYGSTQESLTRTATQSLAFPENEQMLKDIAGQLARDGAALSGVEPASGEEESPAK